MRVLLCESCGGPLDAPWRELVVVCAHCGAQNLPGTPQQVPLRAPADGRPRVNVGGRTYVLESRLAEGDSSVVYRGRWVVRLGERVVVKVQRALSDTEHLRREWKILEQLHKSNARGAEHFRTRLPSLVAHGVLASDHPRVVSVFGWKSGFVHTAHDVGLHHRVGLSVAQVVWVTKRLLELLDFLHRSGVVHGAVTPHHVLIHPRDHGASLVGFTSAYRRGESRRPTPSTWSKLYDGLGDDGRARDVAMACRIAQHLAGWMLPGAVDGSRVRAVIDKGASGTLGDARSLADALTDASRQDLGPPRYHPIDMPGWRA